MYIASLKIPTPNFDDVGNRSILSNKKSDEIEKLERLLNFQSSQNSSKTPGIGFRKIKNTLKKLSKTAGLKRAKKDLDKLPLVTKLVPTQNVKSVSIKKSPAPNVSTQNDLKLQSLSHSRIKKIKKKSKTKKKSSEKDWKLIQTLVK